MVRDPHLAQDVTQSVFVALAKNAARLAERPVLSGWLHRTAQNIAAQTVRTIERRRAREQEAAVMNELLSTESETHWENIAPHLDAALGELNEADRNALFLRYFDKKSAAEMAGILGISHEAAQKRVSRAVERLRELFSKRNVSIGASVLAVLISANGVQSAPAGLVAAISATVLAGTAITTSTAITFTKTIAMTTFQKSLFATAIAVMIGTGVYAVHQTRSRTQNPPFVQPPPAPGQPSSGGDAANTRVLAVQNAPETSPTNTGANAPIPEPTLASTTVLEPPSSMNTPAANGDVPKHSWTDAGFATPQDALRTRGWAVLSGNRERFAESLSISPGARKTLEDMLVQMAAASTAPDRDQMIQEVLKNKWGVEEAFLMPMMALNQEKSFTGYRILSQQSPVPDQRILEVETDMASAPPQQDTLKFQLIGNDWKVVIDQDTLKSMH